MDLYFKRHDGQAVTCEDFFAAMRDSNDADFSNFLLWYAFVLFLILLGHIPLTLLLYENNQKFVQVLASWDTSCQSFFIL